MDQLNSNVRIGTFTWNPNGATASKSVYVEFDVPFPDANYNVALTTRYQGNYNTIVTAIDVEALDSDTTEKKTRYGFYARCSNSVSVTRNFLIDYIAIRS